MIEHKTKKQVWEEYEKYLKSAIVDTIVGYRFEKLFKEINNMKEEKWTPKFIEKEEDLVHELDTLRVFLPKLRSMDIIFDVDYRDIFNIIIKVMGKRGQLETPKDFKLPDNPLFDSIKKNTQKSKSKVKIIPKGTHCELKYILNELKNQSYSLEKLKKLEKELPWLEIKDDWISFHNFNIKRIQHYLSQREVFKNNDMRWLFYFLMMFSLFARNEKSDHIIAFIRFLQAKIVSALEMAIIVRTGEDPTKSIYELDVDLWNNYILPYVNKVLLKDFDVEENLIAKKINKIFQLCSDFGVKNDYGIITYNRSKLREFARIPLSIIEAAVKDKIKRDEQEKAKVKVK